MKRKLDIYKHMLSGVSQMLPFLVAGSILIALSFLFLNTPLGDIAVGPNSTLSDYINRMGTYVMVFILPVLSGFIAYSIANRPALVPGFIGGFLALEGNSRLIGALIAGFLAGYTMLLLSRALKNIPKSLNSIKAIFIFPILGTLIMIVLMVGVNYLIEPTAIRLQDFFANLDGWLAVVLCLIAGSMMAIDMGGPINKIAYLFGILSIASSLPSVLMAAVMVGGMTPPLGIALATLLFKKKFSDEEVKLGKTNWILGATFVTEGAIPFAEKRPKAVLPSIIVGSAIAGAIVGFFGTTLIAPHGGILVIFIMHNWWGFVIALFAGMIMTAIMLGILLKEKEEINIENEMSEA